MAEEEEKLITIPLRSNKNIPRTKRVPFAVRSIKEHVARHMHSTDEEIWIDPKVNELLWARGKKKSPSSIRVRAIKFEDELVEVSLPEE